MVRELSPVATNCVVSGPVAAMRVKVTPSVERSIRKPPSLSLLSAQVRVT